MATTMHWNVFLVALSLDLDDSLFSPGAGTFLVQVRFPGAGCDGVGYDA